MDVKKCSRIFLFIHPMAKELLHNHNPAHATVQGIVIFTQKSEKNSSWIIIFLHAL